MSAKLIDAAQAHFERIAAMSTVIHTERKMVGVGGKDPFDSLVLCWEMRGASRQLWVAAMADMAAVGAEYGAYVSGSYKAGGHCYAQAHVTHRHDDPQPRPTEQPGEVYDPAPQFADL